MNGKELLLTKRGSRLTHWTSTAPDDRACWLQQVMSLLCVELWETETIRQG